MFLCILYAHRFNNSHWEFGSSPSCSNYKNDTHASNRSSNSFVFIRYSFQTFLGLKRIYTLRSKNTSLQNHFLISSHGPGVSSKEIRNRREAKTRQNPFHLFSKFILTSGTFYFLSLPPSHVRISHHPIPRWKWCARDLLALLRRGLYPNGTVNWKLDFSGWITSLLIEFLSLPWIPLLLSSGFGGPRGGLLPRGWTCFQFITFFISCRWNFFLFNYYFLNTLRVIAWVTFRY